MSENENLNNSGTTEQQPGSKEGEKKLSYDELEAELKRVRQEAASRRVENREIKTQAQIELEEAAKKWKEYEDSQKTELQKLQDKLAEKDQKLTSYEMKEMKLGLIDEFQLEKDDLDLLTGSDEASNRKIAERLKAKNDRLKEKENTDIPRPVDLLAGNRGTPVGGTNNDFNDVLGGLLGRRVG